MAFIDSKSDEELLADELARIQPQLQEALAELQSLRAAKAADKEYVRGVAVRAIQEFSALGVVVEGRISRCIADVLATPARAAEKERVRETVRSAVLHFRSTEYTLADSIAARAAEQLSGEPATDDVNFLIRVCTRTKHGKNEIGQPGDCEVNCLKCEAERRLKAVRGW